MYSIDYFINKFESIPEELWNQGILHTPETGSCCALGHCGVREGIGDWKLTEESKALGDIFSGGIVITNDSTYVPVYCVNDGSDYLEETILYPDLTPKQRILTALKAMKP